MSQLSTNDNSYNNAESSPQPDPASKIERKETFEKDGLLFTLHGIEYQIKLLLLIMVRGLNNNYKFRLASERKHAGKFDDIEFQYDDEGELKLRCIQVKHSQDDNVIIKAKDLNNTGDGAFSLHKYFVSYRNIKQNLKPDEILHDLVLFTNKDFDTKILHNFERENDNDVILDIFEKGQRYKLKKESELRIEVEKILKDTSDLKLLIKELVETTKKNKQFNIQRPLFKKYHKSLAKSIIDVKGKTLNVKDFEGKIPKDLFDALLPYDGTTLDVPSSFGSLSEKGDLYDIPNDIISDDEINEFFNMLVFAVNQPSESELFKIVADTMMQNEDEENVRLIDKSFEINQVYYELIEWIKQKESFYLTYKDCQDKFNTAKQLMSKVVLVGQRQIIADEISGYGLEFQDEFLVLKEFLVRSEKQILLLTNSSNSLFSSIKVYQTLKTLPDYKKDDSFIFVRHEMMKNAERVLKAFESTDYSHLLIIEFYTDDDMNQDVFQNLSNILSNNEKKKLILITTNGNPLIQKFKQYETVYDDKNNFEDLSFEAQQNVRKTTKITFQGHIVEMQELLNEHFNNFISENILFNIIKKQEIQIGANLPDIGDVQDYYVEREFREQLPFFPNHLSTEDFYVINQSSVDDCHPEQHQDIVLISDSESDFELLCEKFCSQNIHWFCKIDTFYIWQKSHGQTVAKLRQFLHAHDRKSAKEINQKLVIISAPPGMGKTTELTKLANALKGSNPYLWILRINLVEILDKIKELPRSVVSGQFLREHLWTPTTDQNKDLVLLSEKLFDSCYDHGKVALYLDGFDEIPPDYRHKVVGLIKDLKDSKLHKLYVTTRPYEMLSELEDSLLLFAHTLEELTQENKLTIMTGIWRQLGCNLPDQVVMREAYELINHFNLIGTDFVSPLHIKIVATVCVDYLNPEVDSIVVRKNFKKSELDLAVLYQKFFDILFHDVFIQEKNPGWHADRERLPTGEMIKAEREKTLTLHKHMGFFALFGATDFRKIFPKEFANLPTELELIAKEKYKMGIIDKITFGIPNFSHRTFAEYFCALWLVDEEIWKNSSFKSFFVFQIVKQKVIMQFIGHLMTKNERYATRYPIHLAILKNNETILELLLKNIRINEQTRAFTEKLNEKDNLMQWSPLQCAAELQYNNLVKILKQNGAVGEELFVDNLRDMESELTMLRNQQENSQECILHFAAKRNKVSVFKHLIRTNQFDINERDEYNNTSLHMAAEAGAMDVVEFLKRQYGVDINEQNRHGQTPMHLAVKQEQINVVTDLLSLQNIDVTIQDNNGRTPVHMTVDHPNDNSRDMLLILEFLALANKDQLKTRDYQGHTPLHLASKGNLVQFVKYLIEKQLVDVNALDLNNQTPIQLAVNFNALAVVRYFVEQQNIDINVKNTNGLTLLHEAAMENALEVVKFFIESQHININAVDIDEQTPLHIAAFGNLLNMVQYLCSQPNIDINYPNKDKETPLHLAAKRNALDVVKYFIGLPQVNLNGLNKYKRTPLHVAAENNAAEVVEYLSQCKEFNINDKDMYNRTPLHLAALNHALDVVKKVLLHEKLEINATDVNGDTILQLAVNSNASDITEYIKKNFGALLHNAAANNSLNAVKYLIEIQNVDCNVLDKFERKTPLHTASFNNSVDTVKYLMTFQQTKLSDSNGRTPLHDAVDNDAMDVIKFYITGHKIDLKTVDTQGHTALHHAALKNKVVVFKYLVETGNDDFNRTDKKGRTPLHLAALGNALEIVRYIIEEKKVNIDFSGNDTPLHLAAEGNALSVVKYFFDRHRTKNEDKENHRSPLHRAIWADGLEVVRYLLEEKKVSTDFKDPQQRTLLHHAAIEDALRVTKYFVEQRGFSKTACSEYLDSTPLHLAASKNALKVVKYFIEKQHMNKNIVNKIGRIPLHEAARGNALSVVKYLIQDQKVDGYIRDSKQKSTLHLAAWHNAVDVFKYFIDELNFDLDLLDEDGESLLHFAVYGQSFEMFRYLVEDKGMDPYIKDKLSRTPLHGAAQSQSIEILKYYNDHLHADMNSRDSDNKTPLHLAYEINAKKSKEYLESLQNVNTNLRDTSGRSANYYDPTLRGVANKLWHYFTQNNVN